jgi:glycosyltransferase involved in cell wall biosynthesis
VGRLKPFKRVDVFLRALARARSEEPSISGLIAGDGPEEQALRSHAERLGLSPNGVRFLGHRHDVAGVLSMGDVFVLASESEGMPNVVLEAMAARLPVITTRAGDAADVVESAGAGQVVPFGDVDRVAREMVRLARDASARRALGTAGRAYVERHHSTALLADRLLEIYTRLAAGLKKTRPASAKSVLRVLVSEASA